MCSSGKHAGAGHREQRHGFREAVDGLRQRWLSSSRMAEISVPAWPIPIHHTKLTMANPQPTGMLMPQMPTPLARTSSTDRNTAAACEEAGNRESRPPAKRLGVLQRQMELILSVTVREGVPRSDDRWLAGMARRASFLWSFCTHRSLRLRSPGSDSRSARRQVRRARPRIQIFQQAVIALLAPSSSPRGCWDR